MPNPFDLGDRVAIMTGAGRGIGRAIATVLSEAGAHVVIADIDQQTAADAASDIGSVGRSAISLAVDVAESDSVEKMVADGWPPSDGSTSS